MPERGVTQDNILPHPRGDGRDGGATARRFLRSRSLRPAPSGGRLGLLRANSFDEAGDGWGRGRRRGGHGSRSPGSRILRTVISSNGEHGGRGRRDRGASCGTRGASSRVHCPRRRAAQRTGCRGTRDRWSIQTRRPIERAQASGPKRQRPGARQPRARVGRSARAQGLRAGVTRSR